MSAGLAPRSGAAADQERVLWSFCNHPPCAGGGAEPLAGLIMDGSGNLYGTAVSGTAFELIPNAARTRWTETVLHSFCADFVGGFCIDGAGPAAGLIMDSAGHLYGTTSDGGADNSGTVFELTNTVETVLYSFGAKQKDGVGPEAGLVTSSGHFYGTTLGGGAHGMGTVFELTPDAARTEWTETVLHSYCAEPCRDGYYPKAGLIMDKSGNLYGTNSAGGTRGGGTAFELKP